MTDFRTPMRRTLGLGAAKHGVGHFIGQRVSAAGLVLLVLWGAWSVSGLANGGFGEAVTWLHSPVNAGLTVLTLIVGFYHMQLGMRTVIEDYIARHMTRTALLLANVFVVWGACALAVVSVLMVALGGRI